MPNALRKLSHHQLQSTLAVSLHAPDQATRLSIIPSAKAYDIHELLMDCQRYFEATSRRVTFEYTLLAGVNDDPQQVRACVPL